MTTERERKVQERSMKIVRKYGGYIYKNAQNMYTEKGRPDLAGCVPIKVSRILELFGKDATVGLFVGLEIKRPGLIEDTSDAQDIVGRQIKKAAGIWLPIDDSDVVEALMIRLTGEQKDGL